MRPRSARWAASFAAVLALVAGVVVSTASPAAAATGGPYRVLQFNFCGNAANSKCDVEGSTGAPVDALVSTVLDFKPHVITLNEMCRNQYDALRSRIAAGGWAMSGTFQTTFTGSVLRCTDDNYGIALLTRGALTSVASKCLANCSSPTSTTERRYVVCGSTTLLSTTKVCSTHIGTSGQDAQISTLAGFVGSYAVTVPVIVGGDFNVSPSSNALDRMYADGGGGAAGLFQEADYCSGASGRSAQTSTCNEGTIDVSGTDPKIDYVFGTANDFYSLSADATSATYSDHDPLRTTVYACTGSAC